MPLNCKVRFTKTEQHSWNRVYNFAWEISSKLPISKKAFCSSSLNTDAEAVYSGCAKLFERKFLSEGFFWADFQQVIVTPV